MQFFMENILFDNVTRVNFTTAVVVINIEMYGHSLRRTNVAIFSCKGDFWNSYFLLRATLAEYLLQPYFSFRVLQFQGTATFKGATFGIKFFARAMYLKKQQYQNITCSHLFFRVACRCSLSFQSYFLQDQIEPSILSRVFFLFRYSCRHLFFQG